MKKAILMFAVFAAVGFSSCEKCLTCENSGIETEFCSKDGDERDAFETACEFGGGNIK